MADQEVIARLNDAQLVALTMWAEARGDQADGSSVEERIAVGCAIRNRVRMPQRFGSGYRAVCLAPWQFSCWNAGTDANHQALMALATMVAGGQYTNDPLFDETMFLATGIVTGVILDRVAGATSYYAPASMVPKGSMPGWARGQKPVATVGRQLFFKGV